MEIVAHSKNYLFQ